MRLRVGTSCLDSCEYGNEILVFLNRWKIFLIAWQLLASEK
jgi:hypothetical protein